MISVDEGSTYFCWNIGDKIGKRTDKLCIREKERQTNLGDTLCVGEKGRKFCDA